MCSVRAGRRQRLLTVSYYICNVIMWSLLALCATLLCLLYPRSSTPYMVVPGPKYPPTEGEIWPKPQLQTKEKLYYRFRRSLFNITVINNNCDILRDAIKRYTDLWWRLYSLAKRNRVYQSQKNESRHADTNYQGFVKELRVNLKMPCENYPHYDMDEQYDLKVAAISELNSSSIWGIIRGLESWSQSLYLAEDYQEIYINATYINDYPQYKHRGLLLDTGRHYLSMKNLLITLDAMEMNKMNVLHWHIVDDQSFPYQSLKFPELSNKGAFHKTMVYTRNNMKTVIDYARDRGIRVLPEFDIPGHTRSWGAAYPELLTECYDNLKALVSLGPLNPIRNETYRLLHELIHEVRDLFPDKYIHIGGDEVDLSCWSSNPELQKYMSDHHLNVKQLHALFIRNVIPLLENRSVPIVWQINASKKKYKKALTGPVYLCSACKCVWLCVSTVCIGLGGVGWVTMFSFTECVSSTVVTRTVNPTETEVFDEQVPLSSDTLVQVWKYVWIDEMIRILSSGHRVVFSSSWYLDYLTFSWDTFYADDPRLMVYNSEPDANLANIVGGEACMWGEMVDDSNVISRTWPRTSAVAERLWTGLDYRTPPKEFVTPYVRRRIEEHTCRMKQRGIAAEPPNGPGFCVGLL